MVASAPAAAESSFVFVAPPIATPSFVSPSFASVQEIAPPTRANAPLAPEPEAPIVSPPVPLSPPTKAIVRAAPETLPRSEPDERLTPISASVVRLSALELVTPLHAPVPTKAERARLARAEPATVIRGGVVGGPFPGAAVVADVGGPTPETPREPARRTPHAATKPNTPLAPSAPSPVAPALPPPSLPAGTPLPSPSMSRPLATE